MPVKSTIALLAAMALLAGCAAPGALKASGTAAMTSPIADAMLTSDRQGYSKRTPHP